MLKKPFTYLGHNLPKFGASVIVGTGVRLAFTAAAIQVGIPPIAVAAAAGALTSLLLHLWHAPKGRRWNPGLLLNAILVGAVGGALGDVVGNYIHPSHLSGVPSVRMGVSSPVREAHRILAASTAHVGASGTTMAATSATSSAAAITALPPPVDSVVRHAAHHVHHLHHAAHHAVSAAQNVFNQGSIVQSHYGDGAVIAQHGDKLAFQIPGASHRVIPLDARAVYEYGAVHTLNPDGSVTARLGDFVTTKTGGLHGVFSAMTRVPAPALG